MGWSVRVQGALPAVFWYGLVAVLPACSRKPKDTHAAPVSASSALELAASNAPVASSPEPSAAPLVSAVPGLPGVPVEVAGACTKICKHSEELKCPKLAECMPNCVAAVAVSPCPREFRAMYACLMQQPVSRWRCEEDGVAVSQDAYCQAQQGAIVECMERELKH